MSKEPETYDQSTEGPDVHQARLKVTKSRMKGVFTRFKNQLLDIADDVECPKEDERTAKDKFDSAFERVMDIMNDLLQSYIEAGNSDGADTITEEIATIEREYERTYYEIKSRRRELEHMHVKPSEISGEHELGKDLWKQLKRVSIPTFTGDKRLYPSWKAAFTACVDDAPATGEYKLLQMKQYLSGEALKAIEDLGHSSSAYEAAKERLERKFGGERRLIMKFFDQIEQFKPLISENASELDRFADLIDIAVINLKEYGPEVLKCGSLFIQLQKKLPSSMLVRFHRWRYESSKQESVENLREWIVKESEFAVMAQETVHGLHKGQRKGNRPCETPRTYYTQTTVQKCTFCYAAHHISSCRQFKQLRVEDRWEQAKKLRLCFRCLGTDHRGSNCRRVRQCTVDQCGKSHHWLLHQSVNRKPINDNREERAQNGASNNVPFTHTCQNSTHLGTKKCIALRTVPLYVSNGGQRIKVNALLDDGSTQSYIDTNVASELRLLSNQSTEMTVNMINGKKDTIFTQSVYFGVESLNGQVKTSMIANTIDSISGSLKVFDLNQLTRDWSHLQDIKFPVVASNAKVDMLIGLDYVDFHQSLHEVRGKPGEPIARLTPLGWTCVGNLNVERNFHTFFVHDGSNDVDYTLRKFWEVEEAGVEEGKPLSREDQNALKQVQESLVYNEEIARYEIGIPWKDNRNSLKDNRAMALKRLENIEKRLYRDRKLCCKYSSIINEYKEKGYITKVDENNEVEGSRWYLPHFPVVKPDKSTTKVRIVFDASAKDNGMSLNDTIYQGPKLQQDLLEVLIRFRRHTVAVACDIKEMYLQIGIPVPDRRFHRFLWRTEPDKEPDEFEFTRVVFGVNTSPFLAQYVSQCNAQKFASEYPLAAETVLHSTYMDDSMTSVPTENEGVKLYHELTELWQRAGMFAHKWISNSPTVLEQIPQGSRANKIELTQIEHLSVKTLGVMWSAEKDMFSFQYNPPVENFEVTKRSFLKKVASIYDPLGLLVPYVVRAKILMQKIWLSGADWDEELDPGLSAEIVKWFEEMTELEHIEVQRSLQYNEHETSEVHVFVDASSSAYGAAVYIRNAEGDCVKGVNIVAAKSKVAPLTAVSIPRLELMAAVLGLRLAKTVCKALDCLLKNVTFWSDSMNVLWWIRNQSRSFKPFVANRLGEIHSCTKPEQWRYVPTLENPADHASRGLIVIDLCDSQTWWHGPEFLQKGCDDWPKSKFQQSEQAKVEYRTKSAETMHAHVDQQRKQEDKLDPERFSNWRHLVRINAWIDRFITNCQLAKEDRVMETELQVEEILSTEKRLISRDQANVFEQEYKCLQKGRELPRGSKLASLNPVLDEDGVMRSNSRLKHMEHLAYDSRFPIILPRKSRITTLIVQHYHEKGSHCGTNQTLALLSAHYWIVCGRQAIRDVEHECTKCRRLKGKSVQQIMGPLPDFRLSSSVRAFNQVAVDYAGPFFTKQGRGKTRAKRYLCVFTCMVSRAVHLEMSYGLDTDSFLNTFYRFVSRRGIPELVLSDNGTNFVGAVNELRELFNDIDKNKVIMVSANQGIRWLFNPPCAPHFGGVHESMVKSAKRAIFAILGKAEVNDEELQTAFVGAEGLLNSRPLTYQSSNPSDECVLTPNHFLHGSLGGQLAPEIVDVTNFDIRKRWRLVQELMKHFWKRWFREYLPTLGHRKKWHQEQPDYEVGDVVLIIEPTSPRGHWMMGRITKTYPGADQHIRVVDVHVNGKNVKRPTNRLCLLQKCPTGN